jgi:hypothetical protein
VTLLRDPALAERLGAAAKETVEKDFDWRHLCTAVEMVYEAMNGEERLVSVVPAMNHSLEAHGTRLASKGSGGRA